jgi:hypothetical protein
LGILSVCQQVPFFQGQQCGLLKMKEKHGVVLLVQLRYRLANVNEVFGLQRATPPWFQYMKQRTRCTLSRDSPPSRFYIIQSVKEMEGHLPSQYRVTG